MNDLTISPLQDKIITYLKSAGHSTAKKIATRVYGVPRDQEPTRSQRESVRQAMRSLEGKDIIKMTRYIWDRERCWELTGKMVPIPEKKKPASIKPLAVVK